MIDLDIAGKTDDEAGRHCVNERRTVLEGSNVGRVEARGRLCRHFLEPIRKMPRRWFGPRQVRLEVGVAAELDPHSGLPARSLQAARWRAGSTSYGFAIWRQPAFEAESQDEAGNGASGRSGRLPVIQLSRSVARVGESKDTAVDLAKPFSGRVRPWLANAEIKALVKSTKSGAYPLGHTTREAAVAKILTAMVPEKRRLFWARASEHVEGRVVGGIHYCPLIEAGRRAGAAFAAAIMADPGFKADFPGAKTESRDEPVAL